MPDRVSRRVTVSRSAYCGWEDEIRVMKAWPHVQGVPPRVSVGLPVYNGDAYLAETVESILCQTLSDFELVISDNASTDGTEEVCRSYAAGDRRVRYVRQPRNIGASANYNAVAWMARAPLLKWAAHDDVCAPTYLERCVQILDADPAAVLCHSRPRLIDAHGQPLTSYQGSLVTSDGMSYPPPEPPMSARGLDSQDPVSRYHGVLLETHWCFEIFGVIRRSALLATTMMQSFYGTDKVILADLALSGRFREVDEELWYRRCHPATSTNLTLSERATWSAPSPGRIPAVAHLAAAYFTLPLRRTLPVGARLGAIRVASRKVFRRDKFARVVVPGRGNYLGIGAKRSRTPPPA